MSLLLLLQLLKRVSKQISKGYLTCAFKNTSDHHSLWSEDAKGGLLWAENSAMSTLNLGDQLCGFPFQVTQCEAEHGGDRNQLPSSHRWEGTVKPILMQRLKDKTL